MFYLLWHDWTLKINTFRPILSRLKTLATGVGYEYVHYSVIVANLTI